MDNFFSFVFVHFSFRCLNRLSQQYVGFLILIIYVLISRSVIFFFFPNMSGWFLVPYHALNFILYFIIYTIALYFLSINCNILCLHGVDDTACGFCWLSLMRVCLFVCLWFTVVSLGSLEQCLWQFFRGFALKCTPPGTICGVFLLGTQASWGWFGPYRR